MIQYLLAQVSYLTVLLKFKSQSPSLKFDLKSQMSPNFTFTYILNGWLHVGISLSNFWCSEARQWMYGVDSRNPGFEKSTPHLKGNLQFDFRLGQKVPTLT